MAIKIKLEKPFEKARPHKYIRRLGMPTQYKYIYRPEAAGLVWDKEGGMFVKPPKTPDEHQIKIAKDTLKMPKAKAGVMGGPTKEEAKKILGVKEETGEYGKFVSDPKNWKLFHREPTEAEWQHEKMRVTNMFSKAKGNPGKMEALVTRRMNAIAVGSQKMYNYARALEDENLHEAAAEAYKRAKMSPKTPSSEVSLLTKKPVHLKNIEKEFEKRWEKETKTPAEPGRRISIGEETFKSFILEEPFLKARTPGAKDKRPRTRKTTELDKQLKKLRNSAKLLLETAGRAKHELFGKAE